MFALSGLLKKQFYILGFQIGKNPKLFIWPMTIVTLILATGVFNLNYRYDIELLTITNGIAKQDRNLLQKYFPQNSSHKFSPSRLVYPGRYARLIVHGKDESSIINGDSWSEIEELDKIIREVSIEWEGKRFNYSQLCASWNGVCFHNGHLGMGNIIDRIKNRSLRLSYPVMFNPISFETYTLDQSFGGIVLQENSTNRVDFIQATQLHYFLKNDTNQQDDLGLKWESAVVEKLEGLRHYWRHIKVSYDTYMTMITEGEKTLFATMPYFTLSVMLMVMFTMATSVTSDWVTSKPLVALMGVTSANMGAVASAGVLWFLGVDFIGMVLSVPFIALGVGVDDTFVMLAAWWKTSREDSVPQRLAECYSDAAVSITITTLTDTLSFYVGLLSPIPCIRIYCMYAGTAVLFIYIWHVLFFGGVLAVSGYFEEGNRHGIFLWRKVLKSSEAPHLTGISRWLLTDGKDGSETSEGRKDKNENKAMNFFKDTVSPFLEKGITQVIIILVYLFYIGLSIWGITQMQEGMKFDNFAYKSSYMGEYYENFDKYFWNYPSRLQVVVTTELDYSKKETQNQIKDLVGNLTHLKHATPEYTENWLTQYLLFLDNYKEFYDFNVTTEQDFIDTLRIYFLTNSTVSSEDIKFNENFTKIIATRYVIQSFNGSDATSLTESLIDHRKISKSLQHLNVTVFNPGDVILETTIGLKDTTITLIGIAAVIVMTVVILFIPSVICSVCVFLSIASVELGVLGFMVFWNVNLDLASVVTLIMCVGFSVDFPAHVCHAYISSPFDTVEERIRDTLHSLGLPILQGAASTVIAVSGLIALNSYVTIVFYKIVFLIMLFSVFNALFVLPVFLMITRPEPNPLFCKTKTYIVNK